MRNISRANNYYVHRVKVVINILWCTGQIKRQNGLPGSCNYMVQHVSLPFSVVIQQFNH